MQKGYPPQEPLPPYPEPPAYYGPEYGPQPGFAPAPSPGYAYQGAVASAPAPVTVTHVITSPALKDVPGQMMCPHCHQLVLTTIEYKIGLLTWAICGGIAFFGCFLCCFIPFCLDSSKDVHHHCPSCHSLIYVYKRLN